MMLLKPSSFVKTLFEDMLAKGRVDPRRFKVYNAKTLVDQPRLTVELVNRGELKKKPKNSHEVHSNVVVVSQRAFNSFYRDNFEDDAKGSAWSEGDWVVHVSGMPIDKRVRAAKVRLRVEVRSDKLKVEAFTGD